MEEHIFSRRWLNLGLRAQIALILLLVSGVLWLVFFSPIPQTHDFFHQARHSIGFLACH
jgi:cobalt transporter subunit CbtB